MCVRSDHRGRSRSVDSVSKVVRVLKWSKVVNGQKVVKSGQNWLIVVNGQKATVVTAVKVQRGTIVQRGSQ